MKLGRVAAGTIRQSLRFHGIGLHSGEACAIELSPASPGTGIQFQANGAIVPADFRLVRETPLCTQLVGPNGTPIVNTVEHLMAAFVGTGVSDCTVTLLRGNEIPILDGSSLPFVEAIQGVGVSKQTDAGLPVVRVLRTVRFEDNGRQSMCRIEPHDMHSLQVQLEVDSFSARLPNATTVEWELCFGKDDHAKLFAENLAGARTFGFQQDVEVLRKHKLALGGSLENCVVFKGNGTTETVNVEGLRFEQEWALHKLLDCLGDLAMCFTPFGLLQGKFVASRPGHAATNKLLRNLFSNPSNYEIMME